MNFAEEAFEDAVILNCEKDSRIRNVFEKDFRTDRIVSDIGILVGKKIVPGKTLLFLDEVVSRFLEGRDVNELRNIQKGARAKDFELAIEWLKDAGLVYKVSRVRKAGIPLKFYEDFSGFKLFLLDHGLMGAMVDAPASEILLSENVFEEYKGTFSEQYVLEQLKYYANGGIYYYDSDTSKLELDFIIQFENTLVPIEVKAEENLRSKSLSQFYSNHLDSKPIRISMSAYREQDWLTNYPLFAACRICDGIG